MTPADGPSGCTQHLIDLYTSALVSRASPPSFARRSPDKRAGAGWHRDHAGGKARPFDSVLQRPGSAPPQMIVAGSLADMMRLIPPPTEVLRPTARSANLRLRREGQLRAQEADAAVTIKCMRITQNERRNTRGAQECVKAAGRRELANLQVPARLTRASRKTCTCNESHMFGLTWASNSCFVSSFQCFDLSAQTHPRSLCICLSECLPWEQTIFQQCSTRARLTDPLHLLAPSLPPLKSGKGGSPSHMLYYI